MRFGIRPGVSFSAADFKQQSSAPRARATGGRVEGSFIYVIKGDHNLVKIGVTTNPSARLAQLRTGSAYPIDFAYIGCTPGNGFDIESAAHQMLDRQRLNGEWFDVVPEMAIAAVNASAAKLGVPLQSGTLATADLAIKLAAAGYTADDIDSSGNVIAAKQNEASSSKWGCLFVMLVSFALIIAANLLVSISKP
jgi:hypothetical protein